MAESFPTSTVLVTGASSGLGLALAHALVTRGVGRLILPVRREAAADALLAAFRGRAEVETPALDLASLASVATFLARFRQAAVRLDGVVLNAGTQGSGPLQLTGDGFEATFAVNHLAHHGLLAGLVPHLAAGARVAWIGSGTHDPDDRGATRFGFRGGQYRTSEQVARGDYGAGTAPAQAARDAYATSKLCNIVAASAWAERLGDRARVFAFDPGLMPGTGLARAHGALQRFAWSRVLPLAARFLDGTSTPARSAAILAAFVTGARRLPQNGRYVDCAGEELMPAKAARDPAIAADLMAFCDRQFAAEACMPSIAA